MTMPGAAATAMAQALVSPLRTREDYTFASRETSMHRALTTVVVTLLATATIAEAHANSVSFAEFSIDSRAIRAVVRLPMDDLDLLLRIDRDLDGRISPEELDAARPALAAYLTRHLRLAIGGAQRAAALDRLAVWRDAAGFQYLESALSFAGGSGPLSIRSDFLTELYPAHQTLGRVRVAGREDRFTFNASATYERRLVPERAITVAMVVAGLAILALLWVARRSAFAPFAAARSALRRDKLVAALLILAGATAAYADVIMSAPQLNATLKAMEKLQREAASQATPGREEALFRLGVEADGLASIMNLEVESHGMQERELLDLALSRTKELGVGIAYHRDKKKFFYDGAAFADYLTAAPRGAHAVAAEFKLLSYQFYQSPASDIAALTAAADAKQRFLSRHPAFEANAEMRLYLAVDYRDLHRRYAEARDAGRAAKYRQLARAECLRIEREYPKTEQADAARQLRRSLQEGR
jgi:hypothetical protein